MTRASARGAVSSIRWWISCEGKVLICPHGGGPWTVGARWLQGPGRGARRLAGLRNWCPRAESRSLSGPQGVPCTGCVAVDPARVVPSISALLAGLAAATPTPKAQRILKAQRIRIVEDSDCHRAVAVRTLSARGYAVAEGRHREDALRVDHGAV
jgi:hypothetical protein